MITKANIRCPSCQGPLVPTRLHCTACDLSIKGHFVANEFASLGEDDLHFLRIFVLCEGRIRDMESAMGVSYPTIKARLAQLKAALAPKPAPETPAASPEAKPADHDVATASVLRDLEAGRITYQHALEKLKRK